ncbi:hypothetical protein O1611_g3481 [Lasiodiplodia mahajangana]|uniref:Uncharacterized protein n=1 Tax=Lasiodiplodia mahajangana TaxID=1108764 RepID=A0ACC2JS17_9PEZI|nr:hypothetical protein O1611_g3481 [Lasiodiplodia mahajangana]
MEALPACALTCLAHAATAANCSVTDIACACGNEAFVNYATPCIAGTCTVREALFAKNQTSVQCGVHPHVDKRFVPVIITFFILTLIVVLLRIAARVVSQAKFWYDDYFNSVAFVTATIYTMADIASPPKEEAYGVFAIAVSIARLPYINQFTGTTNPTIDWVPITIWSALENYIGVICACLPSLPALLKPLSALKTPSNAKKSNLSNSFTSQRAQAFEHELEPQRHASAYEMTPTYGKVTDPYYEGRAIMTSGSPQIYHKFNDSEREIQ